MTERNASKPRKKLPVALQFVGSLGLTIAAVGSFGANCSSSEEKGSTNSGEPTAELLVGSRQKSPSTVDGVDGGQLPWEGGQIGYLTAGPHYDGLSGSVRYAVDFAPQAVFNCPGGLPDTAFTVQAAKRGKVITVGDETNLKDKNHSIVEVDIGNGYTEGYMHLSNIKVQKGQTVEAGVALGNPSCEVPPGGRTSGEHVHFYLKRNGTPVDISGLTLSGWKVQESTGNYEGKMVFSNANGQDVRTAFAGRCGPSDASIRACSGLENDFPVGGVSAELPPQSAPENRSVDKPSEALELTDKFIKLLQSASPSDLLAAYTMEIPQSLFDSQGDDPAHLYRIGEYSYLGDETDVKICSDQMKFGHFQNYSLTLLDGPGGNYTTTRQDITHVKEGLPVRNRYAVGVNFTYSDWDNVGGRHPLRSYKPDVYQNMLIFEEVDGRLYISRNYLCFGNPLEVVVGQPLDR